MIKVTNIDKNIVLVKGQSNYFINQFFDLGHEAMGMVISATAESAKLLIIGDASKIKIGDPIKELKGKESIKLYKHYFGKVIDPFGKVIHPIVEENETDLIGERHMSSPAPSILDRKKLTNPLETGIFAIDTMIPIGKGQRQLIIGDRRTGKSSICIDTIINQKNEIKSIYVVIGQKKSYVVNLYNTLKTHNVLDSTIILYSTPDSSLSQLLAPQIGITMAEILAYQGDDVLVILDDLTKHANISREVSLSIDKMPGREAYPTDIFSQHSKVLERAGRFTEKYNNGSITCIPLVETIQGDVASLIPSNVISITDGQIFTSIDLANAGQFPAIDIPRSVSRTGSSVQSNILRGISGKLKRDYQISKEIEKFNEMSVEVSSNTKDLINQGKIFKQMLFQNEHITYSRGTIIALITLYQSDGLRNVNDLKKLSKVINRYIEYMPAAKKVIEEILNYETIDDEARERVKTVFTPLIDALGNRYGTMLTLNEYN